MTEEMELQAGGWQAVAAAKDAEIRQAVDDYLQGIERARLCFELGRQGVALFEQRAELKEARRIIQAKDALISDLQQRIKDLERISNELKIDAHDMRCLRTNLANLAKQPTRR